MSLSYEVTNWENGKTVLKAEHLRKIEKGITDIIAENDAIYKDEDTRKSNEKQRQEEHSRKMNEVSGVVSDIQKDYDSLQKIIIDENASANLQNQINQTNSQLEHIENNLIPIKNKQRIFKPVFGLNLSFWIDSTYEKIESDETMRQRLQNIKNYGYDGYMLILEVQPNKEQRDGFINGNINESELVFRPFPTIERTKWVIEEANKIGLKLLGIEVHCLWVHKNWGRFSDSIFSKMDTALLDIINADIECEFINLYNETNTSIFQDTTKHDYVINSLNLVKNAGYKTGIAGYIREGHKTIPSDLADASDMISVHLYPSISNKGINTDINDGVRAFESHRYIELIEKLYFKHGKEIWITESGCQNYFEALAVPETYYPQGTNSDNNFVQCVYHKGMLEVFKNCSYLKGALAFYLDYSKEYPLLKGLYDYYLREDM